MITGRDFLKIAKSDIQGGCAHEGRDVPCVSQRSQLPKDPQETSMDDYDPDAILADPDAHPIHKLYAEINVGIRDRGERWAKCPNCGEPYQLTPEWSNETVCSSACANDYIAYLNDPGGW